MAEVVAHTPTTRHEGSFRFRAICSCGWEACCPTLMERDADKEAQTHAEEHNG